jgi:hypothetical protein
MCLCLAGALLVILNHTYYNNTTHVCLVCESSHLGAEPLESGGGGVVTVAGEDRPRRS